VCFSHVKQYGTAILNLVATLEKVQSRTHLTFGKELAIAESPFYRWWSRSLSRKVPAFFRPYRTSQSNGRQLYVLQCFVIEKSRVQIQVRRPAIVHSWVLLGPLNIPGWFHEFLTTIRTFFLTFLFHLFAITIRRCSLKQPTTNIVRGHKYVFQRTPNIPFLIVCMECRWTIH